MIKKKGQTIRLDTPNTTMVLRADTAEYLYYGQRLVSNGDLAALPGSGRHFLSTFGSEDYSEYSLLLQGGGFAADFVFSKARVLASKPEIPGLPSSFGEGKAVELKYTDAAARLSLFVYFTAYDDSDVIAVSSRLVNGSRKDVRICRMMSLQLDLAETGLKFTTFSWPRGNECRRCTHRVDGGVFVNDSKSGSLHAASPFVLAEGKFGVCGADLIYSGNHKEVLAAGRSRSRLLVGMSDFAFGWILQPGESFCSPEAVVCYAPDEDALCGRMRAFVGGHIGGGKWKKKERPVTVELAAADLSAEQAASFAAAAKAAGAELLLLSGCGCEGALAAGKEGSAEKEADTVGGAAAGKAEASEKESAAVQEAAEKGDAARLVAEAARGQGLALGIRIEPETAAEDSELFHTRPQYFMKIPGRRPVTIRGRLMLNLAEEKVQNYAVRAACEAIERSGASYVRWDCCRTMTDCFSKGTLASEYFHRYMLGYYRVLSKVVRRFPFVLFEGCAAGGGRLDLGNLSYLSQYRADGASVHGCPALSGAPCAYPQAVIGTNVSAEQGASDEDFAAACCCLLGYSWKSLPPADVRGRMARQIAFYKENRKLLQFGEQFCLRGRGVQGVVTVSKDKSRALAVLSFAPRGPADPPACLCFKGLLPAAVYELRAYGGENFSLALGGDLLMEQPVELPFAPAAGGEGGASVRMLLLSKKKSS